MQDNKCTLIALTREHAELSACALAKMDPWRHLGIGANALLATMVSVSPDSESYGVYQNGTLVGVAVIRRGWLFGDYLKLFGIFSETQRAGCGREALRVLYNKSYNRGSHNLWACVSAFNERALSFYQRNGFEKIGTIPDLVIVGEDEILIRKRL